MCNVSNFLNTGKTGRRQCKHYWKVRSEVR